jgi:hypothetical protein
MRNRGVICSGSESQLLNLSAVTGQVVRGLDVDDLDAQGAST